MSIFSHRRRSVVVVAPTKGRPRTSKATQRWAVDLAEGVATKQEQQRQSRMRYRHRHRLGPWYAAAALLGTVAACWAIQVGAGFGWLVAAVGVASVYIRSAGIPERWRKRFRIAGIAAALWVGSAATAGPSWDAVLWLAVLTVVFSASWWRHHRMGYPTGPLPPDQPDLSVVGMWSRHVGNNDGPVPGSFLTDKTDTRNGEQYAVNLVPGKQTLATALGVVDKIQSGLNVEHGHLVLEQHPSRLPTKLTLTVVRRSPVRETVHYQGPSVVDGVVHLGLYADGDGMAPWRLWTPGETANSGSGWGGLVIGGIGSGKSRLLEELCIGAMSTGWTVVWFVDPQGGASSPALQEHADWYCETDDGSVLDMLKALEAIAAKRAKENAAPRRKWMGFDPSPDRPLILVVIDEAHEVFSDKRYTERWEKLARKCRKVGIGFVALSQYPGLTSFGGSEPLRAAVMGGNGVIMYADSNQNRQLMPGVVVDPLTLPKDLPGFGYTLESRGFGRTAPFRAFYVDDPSAWMARYEMPPLDEKSAEAAGRAYANRRTEPGDVLPMPDLALAPPPPGDALQPPRIITLAQAAERAQQTPQPAQPPLSEAQRKVWDALAAGERTTAELGDATTWGPTRLNNVLRNMTTAGLVTKVAHGRYRRTPGGPDVR
jgi:hypothetical protein